MLGFAAHNSDEEEEEAPQENNRVAAIFKAMPKKNIVTSNGDSQPNPLAPKDQKTITKMFRANAQRSSEEEVKGIKKP